MDDSYYMMTLFILATATVLAVLRRDRSRAMWMGFAVFGWVHLFFGGRTPGLANRPASVGNSPVLFGSYRPRFPHMTLAYRALSEYPAFAVGSNPLKSDYTWHILQSTATMATALVGAVVGGLLWRRDELRRANPAMPRSGAEIVRRALRHDAVEPAGQGSRAAAGLASRAHGNATPSRSVSGELERFTHGLRTGRHAGTSRGCPGGSLASAPPPRRRRGRPSSAPRPGGGPP